MPKKNIVICCDGTGNDFGLRNSNVVKLFSVLEKSPEQQIVYYDPGVGTQSTYDAFSPLTKALMRFSGAAFGYGISKNALDAYAFLMTHYQEGDELFLFGFSRGAYTVRLVAGLINRCGLLHASNTNLLPELLRVFKNTDKDSWHVANAFKRTFCRPEVSIQFLGLWDTVTSVGWIYSPVHFPFTTRNPSVKMVRHAISLDERRAFFPQNLFMKDPKVVEQDVKQVWFAGVHSDVGGGYPKERSGLSNIALEWMLVEASAQGLSIDRDLARKLVNGIPDNHLAAQNEELKGGWVIGEFLPKLKGFPRDQLKWPFNWIYKNSKKDYINLPYVNLFRRRNLKDVAALSLHDSLLKRIEALPSYRPSNLVHKDNSFKFSYEKEPWVRL